MKFLQEKARARSETFFFICLFAAIFLLLLSAVSAAALVSCVIEDWWLSGGRPYCVPFLLSHPWYTFGFVTAAALIYFIVLCAIRAFSLRGGGERIARLLEARHVYPSAREPAERQALNILGELSIAAGIKPPALFIWDDEKTINALAAGTLNNSPVMILTAGTTKLLTRQELTAVMGHELGHILNGDARLNALLIIVMYPLEWLALKGRQQVRALSGEDPDLRLFPRSPHSHTSDKPGVMAPGMVAVVIFATLMIALGAFGLAITHVLKAALFRTRESLADASTVELTRDPLALSACLKKIAALEYGSEISAARADAFSHFFFAPLLSGCARAAGHSYILPQPFVRLF